MHEISRKPKLVVPFLEANIMIFFSNDNLKALDILSTQTLLCDSVSKEIQRELCPHIPRS